MIIDVICNICMAKVKSTNQNWFIGDCCHVICNNCYYINNYCDICRQNIKFVLLNEDFKRKSTIPCYERMEETIKIMKVQINSLLLRNNYLENKARMYKNVLRETKEELIDSETNENSLLKNNHERKNSLQFMDFQMYKKSRKSRWN
ncbi:hypothetical protein NUSPORA_01194 [Nucleospora cyclopteri]